MRFVQESSPAVEDVHAKSVFSDFGCRHCYNLSYESRNEPRLVRYGSIGYPIKAERLYEQLYKRTNRWTYKGKPTKKARKLKILEKEMAGVADVYDLLLKR